MIIPYLEKNPPRTSLFQSPLLWNIRMKRFALECVQPKLWSWTKFPKHLIKRDVGIGMFRVNFSPKKNHRPGSSIWNWEVTIQIWNYILRWETDFKKMKNCTFKVCLKEMFAALYMHYDVPISDINYHMIYTWTLMKVKYFQSNFLSITFIIPVFFLFFFY